MESRLRNEFTLSNMLFEGLRCNQITVEELKKLLNSGKDSVGDLVKLYVTMF